MLNMVDWLWIETVSGEAGLSTSEPLPQSGGAAARPPALPWAATGLGKAGRVGAW